MISVVRRLSFCAGHRVAQHESKCRNLHGHQYELEIYATAPELDSLGRVIDFGVLKEVIGKWVDENLDHGFILWGEDREALGAMAIMKEQKLFQMHSNPTAENIASMMLRISNKLLAETLVTVHKVICHETPNCRAIAER